MRFNFKAYAEMTVKPEVKQVVTPKVKKEDEMVDPSVEETGGVEDGDSGTGESDSE